MGEIVRNIKIKTIIDSTRAISSEDAVELFKVLDATLESKNKLVIDFSEIELLLSVFLNVSIGQLYSKYDFDFLDKSISYEHIDPDDKITLEKVISRAKQYFSDKSGFEDSAKKHFPNG